MTDLRDHIEVERVITPQDWEENHRIYLGATFNLSHKFSQLLYLRPRNRFEELENCYLVGGGTHPEADFQPSMNRPGFPPTLFVTHSEPCIKLHPNGQGRKYKRTEMQRIQCEHAY